MSFFVPQTYLAKGEQESQKKRRVAVMQDLKQLQLGQQVIDADRKAHVTVFKVKIAASAESAAVAGNPTSAATMAAPGGQGAGAKTAVPGEDPGRRSAVIRRRFPAALLPKGVSAAQHRLDSIQKRLAAQQQRVKPMTGSETKARKVVSKKRPRGKPSGNAGGTVRRAGAEGAAEDAVVVVKMTHADRDRVINQQRQQLDLELRSRIASAAAAAAASAASAAVPMGPSDPVRGSPRSSRGPMSTAALRRIEAVGESCAYMRDVLQCVQEGANSLPRPSPSLSLSLSMSGFSLIGTGRGSLGSAMRCTPSGLCQV